MLLGSYLKKLFIMDMAYDYIIYMDIVGNLYFLYYESLFFGGFVR